MQNADHNLANIKKTISLSNKITTRAKQLYIFLYMYEQSSQYNVKKTLINWLTIFNRTKTIKC